MLQINSDALVYKSHSLSHYDNAVVFVQIKAIAITQRKSCRIIALEHLKARIGKPTHIEVLYAKDQNDFLADN